MAKAAEVLVQTLSEQAQSSKHRTTLQRLHHCAPSSRYAILGTMRRVKLAHAISLTVASITIEARTAKTGDIEHPELVGKLQLHETLATKPIVIPDIAIGRRKI